MGDSAKTALEFVKLCPPSAGGLVCWVRGESLKGLLSEFPCWPLLTQPREQRSTTTPQHHNTTTPQHHNTTTPQHHTTAHAHRTPHTAHRTPHNKQRTMHSAQCTKHKAQLTAHNAQRTTHNAQCTTQQTGTLHDNVLLPKRIYRVQLSRRERE